VITSSDHAETLTRLTKQKAFGTNYDVTTNAPMDAFHLRTMGICTDDHPFSVNGLVAMNTGTYDDEHSELLTADLRHRSRPRAHVNVLPDG
jgi:hypothetical protein